jgi:hypothetical protein
MLAHDVLNALTEYAVLRFIAVAMLSPAMPNEMRAAKPSASAQSPTPFA